MKRSITFCAIVGAVLLLTAFLSPLVGMAVRHGQRAETAAYWQMFRALAPLTYTAFIVGVLALCGAIMLRLIRDWARTR